MINQPAIRKDHLPYGYHSIDDSDINAVTNVLKYGWLTGGKEVQSFEEDFKNFVSSQYAYACSNGTTALHLAVSAIGIEPGDEVITTPLTFIASANCVLYQGGTPIFVDIDEQRLEIDPSLIEEKITEKTKAIIAIDYAGLPVKLDELKKICKKNGLYLIEDAAHSVGATYKGKKVGSIADLTTFSFHPVKQMTTGEGGMVTTNSSELAFKIDKLRNHGINKSGAERYGTNANWYYEMQLLGNNYRLTDFQCALGRSQLKKLPAFLKRRQEIANKYHELLSGYNLILPPDDPNCSHAWHLYPIQINRDGSDDSLRNELFSYLRLANIGVNVHYIPVHLHPYYQNKFHYPDNAFPKSEKVFRRLLSLPMFPGMLDSDIEYVANHLEYILNKLEI